MFSSFKLVFVVWNKTCHFIGNSIIIDPLKQQQPWESRDLYEVESCPNLDSRPH